MKISQLSTDKAVSVLCELTPHVESIFVDNDLMEELKTALDFAKAKTRAEQLALILGKFSKIIPILLDKKKNNVFGILAVLNEKTVEEISAQNIIVTMKQIKELSTDKDLIDFFKSWADMEGNE
jgi:hypothetical protein